MSAGETIRELYARAFDRYGTIALWNKRRLDARKLAEEIEAACLAAH